MTTPSFLPLHCQFTFKSDPILPPNNGPPLRDGRTVGEEPQPDQPAGRTIPFLSMQISSLAAFPSLPDEKEFLQPEGANLDENFPLRGVIVA